MLLALAEHADQFGYCFPGLQRLASMCEVSESTAHRMIRHLVSRNLITIERRFNENGSCRSNGYRLAIDHPVNLTGRGVSVTGGTVSTVTGSGVTHDTVTTTKPVIYKTPLLPAPDASIANPRVVSEAQRQALELQVAVLSQNDAQLVLDELAGRMDATRVRNPVRYCARLVERLRRGAFHPDAGLPVARQRQARKLEQRTLQEGATTTRMPVNGAPDGLFESIRSTLKRVRHEPRDEQDDESPETHN